METQSSQPEVEDNQFHQEIDELAREIEESIERHDRLIEQLPDFRPRSQKAQNMEDFLRDVSGRNA